MAVPIQSTDDLDKLFNALSAEVVDSYHYYRLFSNINSSIQEYSQEMNQSNTFWFFTLRALREASMFNLCRLYDQEPGSLSLRNLLLIIQENLQYFSKDDFRARLKGNAFVDSLAETARVPDSDKLNEDLAYTSTQNPLVKKLIILRHNYYAHKSVNTTLKNNEILQNIPLSNDEVLELLNRGHEIYNRYLTLFKAQSWSRMLIGEDDFKNLLNFARVGLRKHEEDFQKEIDFYQQRAPKLDA